MGPIASNVDDSIGSWNDFLFDDDIIMGHGWCILEILHEVMAIGIGIKYSAPSTTALGKSSSLFTGNCITLMPSWPLQQISTSLKETNNKMTRVLLYVSIQAPSSVANVYFIK